jgi:hypothetical protein
MLHGPVVHLSNIKLPNREDAVMAITPVKPGTPEVEFMPSLVDGDDGNGGCQDESSCEALALIQRINARLGASTITPRGVPQVA